MPAILLLIATLALVTRWWDRRDQEARESVRQPAADAGVVGIWESGRQKPSPRPRSDQPVDGQDARAAS